MADADKGPELRQLRGFTRAERLRCVGLVRDAIVGSSGWVTDFHEFSNLSICIEFELPAARLPALAEALAAAEVRLGSESEEMLRGVEGGEPAQCTLQVLFVHDEPDLRRTVLAVPG
jgi:hypothetical protein